MDINAIKQQIFKMTGCTYDGNFEADYFDGVKVKYDGTTVKIGYSTKPQFARACTLLARAISEGKSSLDITETPNFKRCGVMLDMSRGGVMRPEKVKEYLEYMAALGMNMLMLYTEDTYEVEGYERFGFLRGRYTKEELRDIDNYAFSLGIEVIPCIQTLAHLEHFTKWGQGMAISDMPSILCAGLPETYDFIEACVKTVRGIFRSKRIHIGMDEAFNIGRGKYLDINGLHHRKEIITEHLIKVTEICTKYNLRPMMWSDMYFRAPGRVGDFHLDTTVDPEIAAKIPDVDMVYWDYYNTEKDYYCSVIDKHTALSLSTFFAGGIWTWNGFLPCSLYTDRTTPAALTAAIEKGITTVFATLWSNNGCETNHFLAISQLAYFSEYCYKGVEVTTDEIYKMGAFLCGLEKDFYDACGDFHISLDVSNDSFMLDYYPCGKRFVWADILYGLHGSRANPEDYCEKMDRAVDLMKEKAKAHDKNEAIYEYAKKLFRIAGMKCEILYNIYNRYTSGDKKYFSTLAHETLPKLERLYTELQVIHEKQWFSTYKPNGYEVILQRYASTIARLKYTQRIFANYADGKISSIEEFDCNPCYGHAEGKNFENYYSPNW